MLSNNHIDVVFIDAAHDYPSVKSDVIRALRLSTVQWVVFHDYDSHNDSMSFVGSFLWLKNCPFTAISGD